jgi:hypothetical protein
VCFLVFSKNEKSTRIHVVGLSQKRLVFMANSSLLYPSLLIFSAKYKRFTGNDSYAKKSIPEQPMCAFSRVFKDLKKEINGR